MLAELHRVEQALALIDMPAFPLPFATQNR
jgi:hypothetical protein